MDNEAPSRVDIGLDTGSWRNVVSWDFGRTYSATRNTDRGIFDAEGLGTRGFVIAQMVPELIYRLFCRYLRVRSMCVYPGDNCLDCHCTSIRGALLNCLRNAQKDVRHTRRPFSRGWLEAHKLGFRNTGRRCQRRRTSS